MNNQITASAGIPVRRYARAAELTTARVYQQIRERRIPVFRKCRQIMIPGDWVQAQSEALKHQAERLRDRAVALDCLANQGGVR